MNELAEVLDIFLSYPVTHPTEMCLGMIVLVVLFLVAAIDPRPRGKGLTPYEPPLPPRAANSKESWVAGWITGEDDDG
jgi:hypothetical protein